MTVEQLAFKIFERNASSYLPTGVGIEDITFIWQMEDGIREFWINEATAIMKWLEEGN